jgi:hypothetical protein
MMKDRFAAPLRPIQEIDIVMGHVLFGYNKRITIASQIVTKRGHIYKLE